MTPSSLPADGTEKPASLIFPDLKNELVTTRKILERVPDGKSDWRPHEKSMPLDSLATHVAQLPGFGIAILTTDEFEGGSSPRYGPLNSAERLKIFDELTAKIQPLVDQLTWERARGIWKLNFGGRTVAQGPRSNMLRTVFITHMSHHRAQLGVYLRILGVPIPGSYGPSADEPFGVT